MAFTMQRINARVAAGRPTPARAGRRLAVRVNAVGQKLEYLWYDGQEGTADKGLLFNEMRSKTKCMMQPIESLNPADFPDWSYDGSSTGQAKGNNSDCIIKPVRVVPDPIRGAPHLLVMCEVLSPNGEPHPTNTRAQLAALINEKVEQEAPLFGFEQEYTMLKQGTGNVIGVFGRPLAEAHMEACLAAGLTISGINAEVMPGQWEFQIGPVGPLALGDEVMIARWLLHRIGEDYGISSTFDPKPVKGDWNGTGAHTNYSTETMRNPGGMTAIMDAIEKLSKTHAEHISQYGTNNEQRLTGKHETCDINTFRFGVADRGSSIRIPLPVQLKGYGYLEDRRPAANVDPYTVARLLIKTTLL
ncbi:glutamine synthetase [Scenedesmus sp. NREL 46B-D3]|nr:glutamine synthetase [Scenedesmus sp. NREL 46B-D3]